MQGVSFRIYPEGCPVYAAKRMEGHMSKDVQFDADLRLRLSSNLGSIVCEKATTVN